MDWTLYVIFLIVVLVVLFIPCNYDPAIQLKVWLEKQRDKKEK